MTTSARTTDIPRTKIVCTLGPASDSPRMVEALIQSGMSVARLNLSHGTLEQHTAAAATVRAASDRVGAPVGIMVDVPGPKYRTGAVAAGSLELRPGDRLCLTSGSAGGPADRVPVVPPGMHRDAAAGDIVLVDDGRIELRVLEVRGLEVTCQVMRGGVVTEGRGVTTPGKVPSQPYLDERALAALEFATRERADFVALSTVVDESNVRAARAVLDAAGAHAWVISKIERALALKNFDGILGASDAIMVARGDMGTEVPLAELPPIQKDLIRRCNAAGRPVITATQMMESMIHSPVPTRAEVTDVANAVFDGTDAVMLSGETSVGQYPLEATQQMAEVARVAERHLPYRALMEDRGSYRQNQTDDAISYGACETAYQLNAKLIVAFTESGSTALRVSRYRPAAPILGLTPDPDVVRRLTLCWGIAPMAVKRSRTVDDFLAESQDHAAAVPGVGPGSIVVMVAGLPIGIKGGTNLLRVLRLP